MNESLINAVTTGNLKECLELLQHGASPDFKEPKYQATALHWAALQGHLSIVKILVSCSDLEGRDKYGRTPIFYAVKGGHLDILTFLLEQGADFKVRTKVRTTLLIFAATQGHQEIVRFLVEKGLSDIQEKKRNITALFYAAKYGHLEVVKYLFNCGLRGGEVYKRPGYTSSQSNNALTVAMMKRHETKTKEIAERYKEIIGILATEHCLEYELLGDGDYSMYTPYLYALAMEDIEIANLLASKGANIGKHTMTGEENALGLALVHGFPLDFILNLINLAQFDIHCDIYYSVSLLSSLADYSKKLNKEELNILLKALLDAGCDPFVKSGHDETVFHEAASAGCLNLLTLYIENNIQNFEPNKEGNTPLILFLKGLKDEVSFEKCIEVIELLLKNGDSLNVRNHLDESFLTLLLLKNRYLEIDYFLKQGVVDIFEKNKRQETLLHIACKAGVLFSTLRFLLDKGLKACDVDVDGNTPLHLGSKLEKKCLLLLLRSGAKLEETNHFGETVLFSILTACIQFRQMDYLDTNIDLVKYLCETYHVDFMSKCNNKAMLFYILQANQSVLWYCASRGFDLDDDIINEINLPTRHVNMYFFMDGVRDLFDYSQGKKNINIFDPDYSKYNEGFHIRYGEAGNTALHFALLQNNPNIDWIVKLKEKGSNLNLENKYGQTALQLMLSHKHPFINILGLYYKALQCISSEIEMNYFSDSKEKKESKEAGDAKEFQVCCFKAKERIDALKGPLRNDAILLWGKFLGESSEPAHAEEAYEFLKKASENAPRFIEANVLIVKLAQSGKIRLDPSLLMNHLIQAKLNDNQIKKTLFEHFDNTLTEDKTPLNFDSFHIPESCMNLVGSLKQQREAFEEAILGKTLQISDQEMAKEKYKVEILKIKKELNNVTHQIPGNKRHKKNESKENFERSTSNEVNLESENPTDSVLLTHKRKMGSS